MSLENLKAQILSDLPKFGILRPSMEKFDERFDFWMQNCWQKEKFSATEMDALDIYLYAHVIGYHLGSCPISS